MRFAAGDGLKAAITQKRCRESPAAVHPNLKVIARLGVELECAIPGRTGIVNWRAGLSIINGPNYLNLFLGECFRDNTGRQCQYNPLSKQS